MLHPYIGRKVNLNFENAEFSRGRGISDKNYFSSYFSRYFFSRIAKIQRLKWESLKVRQICIVKYLLHEKYVKKKKQIGIPRMWKFL